MQIVINLFVLGQNPIQIAERGVIKSLVRLLAAETGTDQLKEKSAKILQFLASVSNNQLLIAEEDAVQPLINLLSTGSDLSILAATGALQCLAFHPQNVPLIIRTGATKPILQLLATGNDAIKAHAAGLLCNLALNGKTAAGLVREGAIKPLVGLLSGSLIAARMGALALGNLAVVESHQVQIAKEGAVPLLVRLLGCGCEETILYTVRTLVCLAAHSDNQALIVQEGAIKAMVAIVPSLSMTNHGLAAGRIVGQFFFSGPPLIREAVEKIIGKWPDCVNVLFGFPAAPGAASQVERFFILLTSFNNKTTLTRRKAMENREGHFFCWSIPIKIPLFFFT